MARSRHTSKEIESVLKELEARGWEVIEGKGHAWGILRCPMNSKNCRCGEFCQMSVWSTPKNPEQHAKRLRQKALACTKLDEEGEDDG
ncbi:hypothetical protein BJF93_11235 [Xaviernesmea oryzae]|uniref:Type II toxin-antitoxin system HicA family toxin n=1 Tax=Xaviernesmea oryzae TaxID=464029 RepID=A0A1Q9AW34_9HYPH|nr:hypothetical protein [Xaviernesmea oryzae]OLP59642.1 hypothetical protein BJF93_11235 [Xaviernesmea oryzae]